VEEEKSIEILLVKAIEDKRISPELEFSSKSGKDVKFDGKDGKLLCFLFCQIIPGMEDEKW
jgi:hypothetical protein